MRFQDDLTSELSNETFVNFGREPGWFQLKQNNFQYPENSWIEVRIDAIGDTFTSFVNGIQCFKATDKAPLLTGNLGFCVQSNAKVWIDNVQVNETVPVTP